MADVVRKENKSFQDKLQEAREASSLFNFLSEVTELLVGETPEEQATTIMAGPLEAIVPTRTALSKALRAFSKGSKRSLREGAQPFKTMTEALEALFSRQGNVSRTADPFSRLVLENPEGPVNTLDDVARATKLLRNLGQEPNVIGKEANEIVRQSLEEGGTGLNIFTQTPVDDMTFRLGPGGFGEGATGLIDINDMQKFLRNLFGRSLPPELRFDMMLDPQDIEVLRRRFNINPVPGM